MPHRNRNQSLSRVQYKATQILTLLLLLLSATGLVVADRFRANASNRAARFKSSLRGTGFRLYCQVGWFRLTNAHVVNGADTVMTLRAGRNFTGQVFRVKMNYRCGSGGKSKPVIYQLQVSATEQLRPGEWATLPVTPGIDNTVTAGNHSARSSVVMWSTR